MNFFKYGFYAALFSTTASLAAMPEEKREEASSDVTQVVEEEMPVIVGRMLMPLASETNGLYLNRLSKINEKRRRPLMALSAERIIAYMLIKEQLMEVMGGEYNAEKDPEIVQLSQALQDLSQRTEKAYQEEEKRVQAEWEEQIFLKNPVIDGYVMPTHKNQTLHQYRLLVKERAQKNSGLKSIEQIPAQQAESILQSIASKAARGNPYAGEMALDTIKRLHTEHVKEVERQQAVLAPGISR